MEEELTKSNFTQHCDPSLDVTQVQSVVEPRHLVTSHFCNLGHLGKLLRVASDEVEEGESVKVLRTLVGGLDDLDPWL
jgi:hypothetical protein